MEKKGYPRYIICIQADLFVACQLFLSKIPSFILCYMAWVLLRIRFCAPRLLPPFSFSFFRIDFLYVAAISSFNLCNLISFFVGFFHVHESLRFWWTFASGLCVETFLAFSVMSLQVCKVFLIVQWYCIC